MAILEEKLGCADLEEALSAPVEIKDKQLAAVN
jgi:hypothetical protein